MPTATISKRRIDAWDSVLTEAQRWDVYYKMQRGQWQQVARWIEEELSVPAPSRTALYAFVRRLRQHESEHRLSQAVLARQEAGDLATAVTDNETLIDAYMSLAQDLALSNDADTAVKYTKMALDIAAAQTKTKEMLIKQRDQDLREREVAIKEATSREIAVDVLLKQAGKNEQAQALLKQFVEALNQA